MNRINGFHVVMAILLLLLSGCHATGGRMLKIGMKAPDFKLKDHAGNVHSLADYRGRKVALYFYPKDDTPGCTKEACSFRDNFSEFAKRGVVVLGISIDNESSHAAFREKYALPFTLLSDTDKEVVQLYGVWVEKNIYGKKSMGTDRKTFLIDESGTIIHIFDKVKPEEHAGEVLQAFFPER